MGHSGEKIQLIGPSVTWEDHFQTLREAVEGTTGGEAGSPGAVHLLAQLRDLVKVIPFMLELEETRLDFLAPSGGDEFSFIQFRHVPWDWETMSPALKSWFGRSKILNDDGTPMVCYHATAKDFEAFAVDLRSYADG